MSIKDKIKSAWEKARAKKHPSQDKASQSNNNSELAADEVIEHEIFPDKRANARRSAVKAAPKIPSNTAELAKDNLVKSKRASAKNNAANKPASERSRPTNPGYTMIDPDGETCDAGKS